ncbi:MAG TPA: hypothetical protein VLA74_10650 [Nitrososphaeraceae archaeon]|nr:hypothetical protein [Nitrososphaeraceae archaeon]
MGNQTIRDPTLFQIVGSNIKECEKRFGVVAAQRHYSNAQFLASFY